MFFSLLFPSLLLSSTSRDLDSTSGYEELGEGSSFSGSSSSFDSGSASGSASGSGSGSGSSSGSADWGDDDGAATELCSGIIDTNSSRFINSSIDYSFSKLGEAGCAV